MDRALNRNTCKLAAAVHTEQYATTPSYIGASDIIKEQLIEKVTYHDRRQTTKSGRAQHTTYFRFNSTHKGSIHTIPKIHDLC